MNARAAIVQANEGGKTVRINFDTETDALYIRLHDVEVLDFRKRLPMTLDVA